MLQTFLLKLKPWGSSVDIPMVRTFWPKIDVEKAEDWCRENLQKGSWRLRYAKWGFGQGGWAEFPTSFDFKKEEDAVLFKMTWC